MNFEEWAKENDLDDNLSLVYQAIWEAAQQELRADIAEALIHDHESGVRWMNEAAAAAFRVKYPNLIRVLNENIPATIQPTIRRTTEPSTSVVRTDSTT